MSPYHSFGGRPLQQRPGLFIQGHAHEVVLCGIADIEHDTSIKSPNINQVRRQKSVFFPGRFGILRQAAKFRGTHQGLDAKSLAKFRSEELAYVALSVNCQIRSVSVRIDANRNFFMRAGVLRREQTVAVTARILQSESFIRVRIVERRTGGAKEQFQSSVIFPHQDTLSATFVQPQDSPDIIGPSRRRGGTDGVQQQHQPQCCQDC